MGGIFMNKQELIPAPIDNKNILEDFADDIASAFDDGSERRQTFWRNDCLYLIDYTFGTHTGVVKCVYGKPSSSDIQTLKEDLSEVFNDENARYRCKFTEGEKDIHFAFYWIVK